MVFNIQLTNYIELVLISNPIYKLILSLLILIIFESKLTLINLIKKIKASKVNPTRGGLITVLMIFLCVSVSQSFSTSVCHTKDKLLFSSIGANS